MIINQTILEEKKKENELKMYDYLIDNAENDLEVKQIVNLANLAVTLGENNKKYLVLRDKTLKSMGIQLKEMF